MYILNLSGCCFGGGLDKDKSGRRESNQEATAMVK